MRVKILNPLPGGERFTSSERAAHFVESGYAVFTSEKKRKIRFLSTEERTVLISAMRAAEWQKTVGYDSRGILNLKEISSIPVIKPVVLATNPTTRHIYNRFNRNGKVKVIFKAGAERREANEHENRARLPKAA